MKLQLKVLLPSLISCTMAFSAYAEESSTSAADKAAKELANPNTALASLNFKFQYRTFEGDLPGADDQTSKTLLFQPSMPFPREDGTKILFRPAVPMIIDDINGESGIGDISFDLAYAPKAEPGNLLAYGIISSIPTGDDSLGMGETTTLGPEFLYGKLSKDYIWGIFPNHQWDIAGDVDVNLTSSQFFSVWLPGGGWSYGTSPTISYDWNAQSGDEWTIPLNLQVSKTMVFAGRPWKIGVEFNYYVEKPDDFGPEYMISFNITPVVENSLVSWFK